MTAPHSDWGSFSFLGERTKKDIVLLKYIKCYVYIIQFYQSLSARRLQKSAYSTIAKKNTSVAVSLGIFGIPGRRYVRLAKSQLFMTSLHSESLVLLGLFSCRNMFQLSIPHL